MFIILELILFWRQNFIYIYDYGARSGQKWWLLTTVQLELAHEVNLLFHEFGLDLAPRDHSLAQMMTE